MHILIPPLIEPFLLCKKNISTYIVCLAMEKRGLALSFKETVARDFFKFFFIKQSLLVLLDISQSHLEFKKFVVELLKF